MKYKKYLAADDVNHRFINTNRKLKEKKDTLFKAAVSKYTTVFFLFPK